MQTAISSTSNVVDLSAHRHLRLALISDTHGEVSPNVLAEVNRADAVLHAGDIMGGDVIRSLSPRLGVVVCVLGNNDFTATWKQRDSDLLASLRETAIVRCAGGDIAIEHGHRVPQIEVDHFSLAYKYEDMRMVLFGHTHIQRADTDSEPWLVNPGAAGFTRNKSGASCSVLTIDDDCWTIEQFKFAACKRAG